MVCDLTVTGVPWLTARVAKLAAEAAGGAPWAGRAAVIVDQFEAVFTLCDDEGERRALIEGLCDLAQTELVVLALRADFYQQAIRYPGLIRAAQERHVVLGPMSVEQVRRAVVEPARLARTEVAPGLVEVLLADLAPDTDVNGAHEPGALPMLSHALLTAWEHSRGGTLTVADYLAGGGIKEALTRSAERAYESLSPVAAAACPAAVPPSRARGRRAAAKPRGGPARRAAQRDRRGRRTRSGCSRCSSTSE